MIFGNDKNKIKKIESDINTLTDAVLQLQKDHSQLDTFVITQQQIVNARLRELIQKVRGDKKMPKSTKKKKKK